MKNCPKCHQLKALDCFHKNSSKPDGLQPYCKTCADAWRVANKDKIREYDKRKLKKNKKKILKYRRDYYHLRKNDPSFKLLKNMRTRMWFTLKNRANKTESTLKVLGCTHNELIAHIEKQFLPEMTWENYGKWHVDHIKPCASFDLSKPEEQAKCFHYSNLQPLWAIDNIIKGDKAN